jgi:hypothetical protein
VCIVRLAKLYLNLNVLSVKATGQTSIIFPENSLSTAFEIQVDILE